MRLEHQGYLSVSSRPTGYRVPRLAHLLGVAMLGAILAVAGTRAARAASPMIILTTDLGNPDTSVDDVLKPVQLHWDANDIPVQLKLHRIFNIVVSPEQVFGRDDLQVFFPELNLSSAVRDAVERAVEQWNDLDVSTFEFRETVGYTDFIIPGPFGPTPDRVRLDRYNLITFNNADLQFSQFGDDANYAATVVFYTTEPFDLTSETQLPTGTQVIDVIPTGTGRDDLVLDINQDDIADMRLERREYDAGEILDTDIIFNELGIFTLWPEEESELSEIDPPTTINRVIGTPDIELLVTRQLGQAMGGDSSLVPTSVMYNQFQSDVTFDGDPENAPGGSGQFLINPFVGRDLSKQLDAQVMAAILYPGSGGLAGRGGISGIIYRGSQVESDLGDFNSQIPQVPVYVGRPTAINPEFVLPTDVNSNRGPIRIEANVLSGLDQEIALGERLALLHPDRGHYSIPGLPPAEDYGVRIDAATGLNYQGAVASLQSELFNQINNDGDFEPEWWGGAGLDPGFTADSSIDATDGEGDTIISNSFIAAAFTGLGDAASRVSNGTQFIDFAQLGTFSFRIEYPDGTIVENAFDADTDSPDIVTAVDDTTDEFFISFTIESTLNVLVRYSLVDLQATGRADDLLVDVSVGNLTTDNLKVGLRYFWNPIFARVSAETTNTTEGIVNELLYVNGALAFQEAEYAPPPASVEIRDNVSADPREIYSLFTTGFGLTTPSRLVLASLFNLSLYGDDYSYAQRGGPFIDTSLNGDDDNAPITANSVVLVYWDNNTLPASGALTFSTAAGVSKLGFLPETGQAFDEADPDFLDDNPFVSDPVSVRSGSITSGIDFVTNDGPDHADPPGTTPDGETPGGGGTGGPVVIPNNQLPDFDDGNQDSDVLPADSLVAFGGAVGDVDNDGDLDIMLAVGGRNVDDGSEGINAGLANRLYINQFMETGGERRFIDVTFGPDGIPSSEVTSDDRIPYQQDASFDVELADFDLDGDLDAFVSNFSPPSNESFIPGRQNRLWLNQGGDQGGSIGTFRDATQLLPGILNSGPDTAYFNPGISFLRGGINQPGLTFDTTYRSTVGDIDNDGDLDIVVANSDMFADSIGSIGFWGPSIDPANEDAAVFCDLAFSERLLINTEIDIDLDTSLPTEFHGTLRFFDETLGARGFSSTIWSGDERLPALYPNFAGNDTPFSAGVNEADHSDTSMVMLGLFDFAGSGPDLYIANRRPLGNEGISNGFANGISRRPGQDMVYSNTDINGDLIPDGFFVNISGGIDGPLAILPLDQQTPSIFATVPTPAISIFDGDNGDAQSPENDFVTLRSGHSMFVTAYDWGSRGTGTAFVTTTLSDASTDGLPSFILTDPRNSAFIRSAGLIGSQSGANLSAPYFADAGFPAFASATTNGVEALPGALGRPATAAVADFNLDGDQDIMLASDDGTSIGTYVTANLGRGFLQYFSSDGTAAPVLTEQTSTLELNDDALRQPWFYLEPGDFDNDGDPDVLALTEGSGIRVFYNQIVQAVRPDPLSNSDFPLFVDETYKYMYPYANVGLFPGLNDAIVNATTSIDFSDVNNDGLVDIAVGSGGVYTINGDFSRMYINTGKRPWNESSKVFSPAIAPHPGPRLFSDFDGFETLFARPTTWLRFADLDLDGAPDVFSTNYGTRNQIYFNVDSDDLSRNSQPDGEDFPVGDRRYDPDGKADGVFVNLTLDRLPFGDSSLELSRHFAYGNFTSGDSRIDIVIANGPFVRNVLLINELPGTPNSNGGLFVDRSFNLPIPRLPDGSSTPDDTLQIHASDFDGDGDLDLFVLNRFRVSIVDGLPVITSPRSRLYFNDGTGVFTDVTAGDDGILDTEDDRLPRITGAVTAATVADFDMAGDITEDLNGNRLLESNELEFLAKNDSIDRDLLPTETEDLNGNGILDSPEDLNGNGILDAGEDTNLNGILDSPEDTGILVITNPTDLTAVRIGAGNGLLDTFDLNGNGTIEIRNGSVFEASYDIFVVRSATGTGSGADNLLLLNDGTGHFRIPPSGVPPTGDNSFAVDSGAITLRSRREFVLGPGGSTFVAVDRPFVDIVIGNDERNFGDGQGNSATLLVNNTSSPGSFLDRSIEIPLTTALAFSNDPDTAGEPESPDTISGDVRAIRLADIDNDGDLDMYMGQTGSFSGQTSGAPDWIFTNRTISSNLLAQSIVGDQPGVAAKPKVNLVMPPFALPGAEVSLIIYGSNFMKGLLVDFGPGTTVTRYNAVQNNAMAITLRIDANADLGYRTVSVKLPNGALSKTPGLFQVGAGTGTPAVKWDEFE